MVGSGATSHGKVGKKEGKRNQALYLGFKGLPTPISSGCDEREVGYDLKISGGIRKKKTCY